MSNISIRKDNTLTILDWDDTLFPSTWINNISNGNINLKDEGVRNKYKRILENYDKILYNFLKKLNDISKIIIITNALPVWVEISSSILPNTLEIIKNVKVISAKQDFKNLSNSMDEWKKFAFKRELLIYSNESDINNLISIGDAEYEYNALLEIIKDHKSDNKKLFKAIKLLRYPELEILEDQIILLDKNINNIIKKSNHLDLSFRNI